MILFIVIVQGIIEAPLKQNFTVFDAYIVCDYISSNHFLTQKNIIITICKLHTHTSKDQKLKKFEMMSSAPWCFTLQLQETQN